MLVHWVEVIWAKDGGSGTPWDPTIIFFRKKPTSLNATRLNPKHSTCYMCYGIRSPENDFQNYRPITPIVQALFVFNGNFNVEWIDLVLTHPSYLKMDKMTIFRHVGNDLNVPLEVSSIHQTIKGDSRDV